MTATRGWCTGQMLLGGQSAVPVCNQEQSLRRSSIQVSNFIQKTLCSSFGSMWAYWGIGLSAERASAEHSEPGPSCCCLAPARSCACCGPAGGCVGLENCKYSSLVVLFSGLISPEGLAIDHFRRTMYWTDSGLDKIERARLDGSERKALFHTELVNPRAIAVDPIRGSAGLPDSPATCRS